MSFGSFPIGSVPIGGSFEAVGSTTTGGTVFVIHVGVRQKIFTIQARDLTFHVPIRP